MKSFRLIPILILAGVFLVTFFVFLDQTAKAQEPDPPFPGNAYLDLRSSTIPRHDISSSFSQGISQALASTDIITNVLDVGDNLIQGLIYYDGYLWGSTRTQPARILKINPSTLEVETGGRIILGAGLNEGEDIVAAQGYIWVILYTNPAQLIRVDPDTVTAEVAISFPSGQLSYGASLEYAFGSLWAGGLRRIAQINISEPLTPTYQSYDYGSLVIETNGLFGALTSSQNYLWGSMLQYIEPTGYFSSTVVKIDPAAPNDTSTSTISEIIAEDITYTGSHLFISSENIGNPSDIYQFASDLSTYTMTRAADSASYGTFLNPLDSETFWGVYLGSPGIVKKFDLSPSAMVTITLPLNFDDPNELTFDDSGNLYVSTWSTPTGIIKYTAPISVSDLGISQSSTDAVLNWGHLGGDVTYYQVWRSTDSSFTPGDAVSSKLGEVIYSGSTVVFTDTNAIGDALPKYYYAVKSVNSYGLVSPASNMVSMENTTTTISSHSPNPSTVGQAVTVSYTVTSSGGTPTGDVTVRDGTDSCTATVADGGCSITFLSSGTKTLVATYDANKNFYSSISAGVTHVVTADDPSKADTTTTITSQTPNPSKIGQAVTVSYTVTTVSGTPTGNVVVSDGTDSCTGTVATGSCSLNFSSVGTKTLTAIYVGDSNFNSSVSAGVTQIVTADTTTTVNSHTPSPSDVGEEVIVAYTVTSEGGSPTGNVTVSDGTDSCTATVADGECSMTFLSSGTKTLVATYDGDINFNSSISAEVTHVVTADDPTKADTITAITSNTPNPSKVEQAVIVSYTVTTVSGTPTGDVVVGDGADSCTGTVISGSCSLNFSSAGMKTLTAIYVGDSNFNSSVSAGVTHTVSEAEDNTLHLPLIIH